MNTDYTIGLDLLCGSKSPSCLSHVTSGEHLFMVRSASEYGYSASEMWKRRFDDVEICMQESKDTKKRQP
jgi:hypothetical protein